MNDRIQEHANSMHILSILSSCETSKSNRNEVKLSVGDMLSIIIDL